MSAAPAAALALRPTACALCETYDNTVEFYPATVAASALDVSLYSARRVPDRAHFRLVRCLGCGLVRSDPTADLMLVAGLYRRATFDYADEVAFLRATYGRYLSKVAALTGRQGTLLDIGCGSGFVLEEALASGFEDARGVEPSLAAVAAAAPHVRPRIVPDLMAAGLFDAESFDVVTLFQTLDHIVDPNELLAEIARLLRPRGVVLCLNHDVEALSARLLGERSPIFDVEHTYLFSRRTLSALFEKHGLAPIAGGWVVNRYSARYLTQLLPLRRPARQAALRSLSGRRIGRIPISLPLGNLWLAARKP